MPDRIKEAYEAIKSSGIFLDEGDFRDQLTRNSKEVFNLFSTEKTTKGLFLDYSDFESSLELKKKEAGKNWWDVSEISSKPTTSAGPSPNVKKPEEFPYLNEADGRKRYLNPEKLGTPGDIANQVHRIKIPEAGHVSDELGSAVDTFKQEVGSDDPVKSILDPIREKNKKASDAFTPLLNNEFFRTGESTAQKTPGNKIKAENDWEDYTIKHNKLYDGLAKSNAVQNYVKEYTFNNGLEAKKYADAKIAANGGKAPDGNETFDLAKQKIAEYDNTVSEIEQSKNLEDYFLKKYRRENPHFDEQVKALEMAHPNEFINGMIDYRELIGNAKMGQIVSRGLQDRNIPAFVESGAPNVYGGPKNLYQEEYYHLSNNLLKEFPDFGVNVVANEVSRKRQELHKNSYFADFDSGKNQEITDKIAADLYANNPTKKKIYDEIVSKDLKKYIDVPGFLNRLSGGIEKQLTGLKNTFSNQTASENIRESINDEATQVSAGEKGAYKIIGEISDFGGFLMSMAATGNVAKGLAGFTGGLTASTAFNPSPALNAAIGKGVAASTFLGDALKEGDAKYPGEPGKAILSGYTTAASYVAMLNLLPANKISEVMGVGKKSIKDVLEALSSENIAMAAKKELATNWFKKSLEAAGLFTKGYSKSLGEILAITKFKQGMDKILGLNEQKYQQVHPASEDEDVLKLFAVASFAPSLIGAYHDFKNRNFTKDAVWDVASSPRRFARTLAENDNFSGMTKEEVAKVLEKVLFLNKVKRSLDEQDMPEAKQKSYLLQTANEMRLETEAAEAQGKADQEGEPVLKKKAEEKVKEIQKLIGDSQKTKEEIIDSEVPPPVDNLPQDPKTDKEWEEKIFAETDQVKKDELVAQYGQWEKEQKKEKPVEQKTEPATKEEEKSQVPEEILLSEVENGNIKDAYGAELKKDPSKAKEVLLGLAKQKYGLDDDGKANKFGGAPISNPEVDRAITIAFPDKEVLVNAINSEPGAGIYNQPALIHGKYKVTNVGGKRVIRYSNGQLVKRNKTGYNNFLLQHAKKYNYNIGKLAPQDQAPDFNSAEDAAKWVVDNSANPAEIASTWLQLPRQPQELSSVEQAIAIEGIGKVKQESFERVKDKNLISGSVAKNYFSKKGRSLDDIANSISQHGEGVEVTPDDVAEFMMRFPWGIDPDGTVKSEVHHQAETKFAELTGIPLSSGNGREAIAKLAASQHVAPDEAYKGGDADYEAMPQAEKDQWLKEMAEQEVLENDESSDNFNDQENEPGQDDIDREDTPEHSGEPVRDEDTGDDTTGAPGEIPGDAGGRPGTEGGAQRAGNAPGADEALKEQARKDLNNIFGNDLSAKEQIKLDFDNPTQHEGTIKNKEGKSEAVQYESINGSAEYGTISGTVQRPGETPSNDSHNIRTVEQVWSEEHGLRFTGTASVKSAADVAHIMRLLEDKSIEFGFAVHVDKQGNSHIQFVSMGAVTETPMDRKMILAGAKKFSAVKTYLIHNHPSGQMTPSSADIGLTKGTGKMMDELGIEMEHLIMDTYKEEYVLLDKYGNQEGIFKREEKPAEGEPLAVHKLDGMKALSAPISEPPFNSEEVAGVIYGLRFSAIPKAGMLIADAKSSIIGNYVFKDGMNSKEMLENFAGHAAATTIFLYGNRPVNEVTGELRAMMETCGVSNIALFDYINVVGGGPDVQGAYDYISAADQGILKDDVQKKYGTNKLSNTGLKDELKAAQALLTKAQKDLRDAEDKIAKTQAAQGGMFGGSEQVSLFGVKRDEAKNILDPLRLKVNEAKAAVEKLQVKSRDEDRQAKGQTSLFDPQAEYGDKAAKVEEWVKKQKAAGMSDKDITDILQERTAMSKKEAEDYVDQFATGHYSDIPKEATTDNRLMPIDFPELVQLARTIAEGKYPEIKKLATAFGYFSPALKKIVLNRELFNPAHYDDLMKTMAHEIGHFVDFIPDETLSRGNILGRIASLKAFMEKFLPKEPGGPGPLTQADIDRITAEEKAKPDDDIITEEDEYIEKVTGLTPDDVLAVWNDVQAGINNPALLDFIQRLSTKDKKRIVVAAMKGLIDDMLKKFTKIEKIPTGNKIQVITKGEGWRDRAKDRIRDEMNKRMLWEERKIYEEAYRFSKLWRPYDEATASPGFRKYRKSSVEIYADMISGLFNSPGQLEKKAPMFFQAFMNYLDQKPAFKAVYEDLMDLLTDPEKVKAEREKNTIEGYRKAEAKRADLLKIEKRNEGLWARVKREMFSVFSPLGDKLDTTKTGNKLSQYEETRNAFEQMEMWKAPAALMLNNYNTKTVKPVRDAGVSLDDVGLIVQYTRNMSPARKGKGNPLGLQTDEQNLDLIQKVLDKYTSAQQDVIQEALDNFYELGFNTIEDAYDSGLMSRDQMDEAEKNKFNYATYKPVKYITELIQSAQMLGIQGGLGEIANPFLETMVKMVMVQRAASKNRAIVIGKESLQKVDPDSVIACAYDFRGNPSVKLKPGQEYIRYKQGGKNKIFITEKYIAEVYNAHPPEKVSLVNEMLSAAAIPLRMAWTKYNPGFIFIVNPVKDSKRTIKNTIAILSANGALQKRDFIKIHAEYAQSWWASYYDTKSFFKHEPTGVAKRMLEYGAVNPESALFAGFDANYNGMANFLSHYDFLSGHLGISKRRTLMTKIRDLALIIPEYFLAKPGSHIEMRTKVAMFKILEKHMGPEAAAYYTRNYIGTPNYSERFGAKKFISWIPFSSVILQGLRTDAGIATAPKGKGAYWLYVGLTIGIPALLTAAAKNGLFGKDLEDWFEKVGSYNRSNYMLIPLGVTETGKAKGLKIPLDDVETFTWNNIQNLTEKTSVKQKIRGVLDGVVNRLPDYQSGVDLYSKWWEYAVNDINPYDKFKKRNVIGDRNFKMGGKEALGDMFKWSLNKLGIRVPQYDDGTMSTKEKIISMIPALRRIYFETDRGDREALDKVQSEQERKAAIRLQGIDVDLKKALDAQTDSVVKGGEVDMRKLIFDTFKAYTGKDAPQTEQDGRDMQTIASKAIVLLKKDDVKNLAQSAKEKMFANQIINVQSNETKKAIVDLYKADATEQEFSDFVKFLKDNRIYMYRP